METQAQINKMIRKASAVYVRVSGTEFDVKISKAEAVALNKYQAGNLTTQCVGRLPNGTGDLYLEGRI